MTSEDYVRNALKTENVDFEAIKERLKDDKSIRLLHGFMGVTTEGGELQDALKKHLIYGQELDAVNILEEVGDVFWYLAIIVSALDGSFEQTFETNIEKLKARYGDKFTEEKAINRDTSKEREILEGKDQ